MTRLRMPAAIAIVALAVTLGFSGIARAEEGRVNTRNSSDAYVWVSASYYHGSSDSVDSWCVKPGEYDEHSLLFKVRRVQFEVSRLGCRGEGGDVLRVAYSFPVWEKVQSYVASGSKTTHYAVK